MYVYTSHDHIYTVYTVVIGIVLFHGSRNLTTEYPITDNMNPKIRILDRVRSYTP